MAFCGGLRPTVSSESQFRPAVIFLMYVLLAKQSNVYFESRCSHCKLLLFWQCFGEIDHL